MNGSASWTLSAPAGAVMDLDAQAVGPKVEGNGFAASFGPYEVKRFPIRWAGSAGRGEPRERAASRHHPFQRPQRHPRLDRLAQGQPRPRLARELERVAEHGSAVRGHRDADGVGYVARQLADGVDAVLAWHEDVHEHDVGRPPAVLLETVLAIHRPRDLVALRAEQHVEDVARVVVIFDDEDVNRGEPEPGESGAGERPRHRRSRSEEHTSELQSHHDLVCRLLLEKKKKKQKKNKTQ